MSSGPVLTLTQITPFGEPSSSTSSKLAFDQKPNCFGVSEKQSIPQLVTLARKPHDPKEDDK
jgi:hypothetical protein